MEPENTGDFIAYRGFIGTGVEGIDHFG